MFDPHPNITREVIFGLGWMYLLLFALNAAWAIRSMKHDGHFQVRLLGLLEGGMSIPVAALWALYAIMLFLVGIVHLTFLDGDPGTYVFGLPEGIKAAIDPMFSPVRYFSLSVVGFALVLLFRKWFVKPTVGWILLNAALLFMTLSMTDWDFRQIVGKPDNVPIVSMLFIVGFFTWLYLKRAVDNDERQSQGRPLFEQEDNEKVLVWPDLVYTELICMILLTAVLVAWGVALQAPLEEPASAANTPNPSKAPWYFLGLQEMLVYYDPWLAGVVFPSLIIVGLMAIPYIDFNQKGNGYYTFNDRKFAVAMFTFGFIPLWVAMIILGTFLRGPNWNFFGIYEFWDVHKVEVLENVYLSDMFWIGLLGRATPVAPAGAPWYLEAGYVLLREWLGIVLVLAYLLVLPPLLAMTAFRRFYVRMGFIRYMVFCNLVLMMAALPIKMVLRWSINLKYLVKIPEYFFNI